MLEDLGCEVVTAADAAEASELLPRADLPMVRKPFNREDLARVGADVQINERAGEPNKRADASGLSPGATGSPRPLAPEAGIRVSASLSRSLL